MPWKQASTTTFSAADVQNIVQSASETIGPIQHRNNHAVVYRWDGPFQDLYLRMHLSADDAVLSFDVESTIPQPVELPPPPAGLSPVQDRYAERLSEVQDILSNAKTIRPVRIGPKAMARLRKALREDAPDPFTPDPDTMFQAEYIERRTAWYRRQWLENYRLHSRKDAEWADAAEQFLQLAVEQIGAHGFTQSAVDKVRPTALELASKNCDDPLVLSVIRQFTIHPNLLGLNLPASILEGYFNSTYPANAAWLAAFPEMTAEHLLKLQAIRTPDGADPKHDLLDVHDPVEMRILFERLTRNARFDIRGDTGFHKETDVQRVLATQNPSLWLKHMLLAAIAWAKRDIDGTRISLCNSWHQAPQNPEAAALMIHLAFSEHPVS